MNNKNKPANHDPACHDQCNHEDKGSGLSRRSMLKGGAAMAATVATGAMAQQWDAPAVNTGSVAGMNVMRDTARFIIAMEQGFVDIGALITSTSNLEQVKEGFQGVADRTEIGVVITP